MNRYCTSTHLTTPTTPTIYHTLLSLYLRPPPPHTVDLPPALHLLSRHGSRLSASETLALIPEDTKMAALTSYFQSRIRTANTAGADARLRAMLRRSYLVHVQEDAVEATGGHVIVGEERGCGVCHKRLGAHSSRRGEKAITGKAPVIVIFPSPGPRPKTPPN